jgi:hypothetical protein
VTDTTADAVRLDDLAEPRFAPEVEPLREMMAAIAPDCPLDAEALHAKAAAETGLDDFGADITVNVSTCIWLRCMRFRR